MATETKVPTLNVGDKIEKEHWSLLEVGDELQCVDGYGILNCTIATPVGKDGNFTAQETNGFPYHLSNLSWFLVSKANKPKEEPVNQLAEWVEDKVSALQQECRSKDNIILEYMRKQDEILKLSGKFLHLLPREYAQELLNIIGDIR
jgi:hypothetical protein